MTNNMLKNQEAAKQSESSGPVMIPRRTLLRKAMVASGVLAGAHLLPEKWFRPLVEQIVVPVHAETSGEPEDPPPPQSLKRVFVYTGGDQEFVVPAGVTSLDVKIDGGDGGGGGGGANWTFTDLLGGNGGAGSNGETVFDTLAVTPGETLIFRIGGGGSPGLGAAQTAPSSSGGMGGFPDGVPGSPGLLTQSGGGGGSGGTTSILHGATLLLLVSAQGGHGGGGGGLRTAVDMNCDGQDGRFGGAGGEANGGDGGAGYQAPFDDGGAGGAGGNSEGEAGLAGNNGEIELFY